MREFLGRRLVYVSFVVSSNSTFVRGNSVEECHVPLKYPLLFI